MYRTIYDIPPSTQTRTPRCPRNLCTKFGLFERVSRLVILSQPYLLLLLGWYMLNPYLLCVIRHKLPIVSGIPQLAGNAEIFAAAH